MPIIFFIASFVFVTKLFLNASDLTPKTSADQGLPIWFRNECPYDVRLFVKWETPGERWTVNGPWQVSAHKKFFLDLDDGSKIRAASPDIYIYVTATDADFVLRGTYNETFKGQNLPMTKASVETNGMARYDLGINCLVEPIG